MTEEEQAAITDLFYIFFIHLKDYFNIKVFPAIIFSKILDFVLDKEFFFIHTYIVIFSFVDTEFYARKVRMH